MSSWNMILCFGMGFFLCFIQNYCAVTSSVFTERNGVKMYREALMLKRLSI